MAESSARASFRRAHHSPSTKNGDMVPTSPPEARSTANKASERRTSEGASPGRSHHHHHNHHQPQQRHPQAQNSSPTTRGPRNLLLHRGKDGFGFTLRHFIVYPPDSYSVLAGEQRLGIRQAHGRSDDPMDTIFVKNVREQSTAHQAGLRTGDRIVCVNGKVGLNYAQVVQLIQHSETYLHLLVVPKEDDLLQQYFSDTAHNPYTNQRPWEIHPQAAPDVGMKARSTSSLRSQHSSSPRNMLTYPSSAAAHAEPLTGRLLETRSLTRQGSNRRASEGSVGGRPLNGHQTSSAESVRSAVAAAASRRISEERRRDSSASLPNDSPRLSISSDVDADPSVITRIKKSFEQKEEFLKRPNQPICLPPTVREFYAVPNKFQKPQWPPAANGELLEVYDDEDAESLSPPLSASATAKAQFMYGGPVTTFAATSSPLKQNPNPRAFVTTLSKITENLASSTLNPAAAPAAADPAAGLVSPLSQMVSKRAKQFESGHVEEDKTVLYRSELARLSAKKVVPDVAHRKQEFESLSKESKSLDTAPRSPPPLPAHAVPLVSVSPPPLPTPPASPGPTCPLLSKAKVAIRTRDLPIFGSLSGNRLIPVGGRYVACEEIPGWLEDNDDSSDDFNKQESSTSMEVHAAPRTRSNSIESWPKAPSSTWDSRRSSTPTVSEPNVEVTARPARPSHLNLQNPVRPPSPPPACTAEDGVTTTTGAAEPRESAHTAPEGRNNNEATPAVVGGVQLRQPRQHSLEVEAERAVRRESYLKATWSERMDSSDVSDNDATKPTESPAGSPSEEKSISKLHDLFGKQAEKILNEGWLQCKVSLQEGKRATDRSWKQVWAVLRTNALHLRKERRDNTSSSGHGTGSADEVVPLQGCLVDAAADYTKKKHVLRLHTPSNTQLLLQAEDPQDMAKWLKLLRPQSLESVKDDSSAETPPTSPPFNTGNSSPPQGPRISPVPAHKGIRKLTTSFRNRSPTGQSPVNKTRKPCQNVEPLASPKTKTWKGRVAKQLRKMQGNSPSSPTTPHPEGCTIGIPLEFCPQSNVSEFVPWLLVQCTRIVEERGLEVIGIYRVPGNTAAVASLTEAANRGSDANNLQDPRWNDVNVISSLLKSFFRKLPDALFTSELYPHFVLADKIDEPTRRLREIRKLVHELPEHHYETLRYLMAHLSKIVYHSDTNKMEAKNLAIVFGPTLLRASDDNMVAMVTDMPHQCRIVESLISHAEWFFCEEDDPEEPDLINYPQCLPEPDNAADAANHALLLNNIHKVEGLKADSPSKELSAKEIVSSIISAANKKMQKAKSKRGMRLNSEDSTDARDADDKVAEKSSKESESLDTPSIASSILSSVLFSGNIVKSIHAANPEHVPQQQAPPRVPEHAPQQQSGAVKMLDGALIHSYTGLSASTQERVRRFEMETKAVLSKDYSKHRLDERRGSAGADTEDYISSPIEIRKKQPDAARDSSSNRHSLQLSSTVVAKPPSGSPRSSLAAAPTPHLSESRTALAVLNSLRNIRRGNSVENLSASSPQDKSKSDSQKSNGSLKRLKTEKEMAQSMSSSNLGNMRCGSLDSLQDSCGPENVKVVEVVTGNRPYSEASDDGHDLLEILTSTFDLKMKSLMSQGQEQVDASPKSAEMKTEQPGVEGDFRPYRDPSLHRSKNRMSDSGNGSPQDSPNKSSKSREKENRSRKRDSGSGLSKLEKEVRNNCQVLAPSNVFLARMKRKSGAYSHRGIKRRHTVGGTKDLAKMGWPEEGPPGPVLTEAQQQAALRSWLQRGRLRSSSPELSPRTAAVVLLLAAELAALKKPSKKSSPDILAGLGIPLESHV